MHLIEDTSHPVQAFGAVSARRQLAGGLFELQVTVPEIASLSRPGQFVHITCGDANFLRRPISICDAADGVLRLVFQQKGEGTAWLAARTEGDPLDLLGPLGRGFDLSALGPRPVFVGGGIGVPPLLLAMKQAKAQGMSPAAILGFRDRDAVILESDFRALGETLVATDNGSYGTHGFVTALLEARAGSFTSVCACGPRGMLRAVAGIAETHGLPCQVSMEERMGCGIGACLVCACALKGADGGTRYGHVCKDGPVFDAKEVEW